jgi:competence protein ComEA
MSSNWAKDYFTFTKRERVAIFMLVVSILAVYFLPELLSSQPYALNPKQVAYFDSISALFDQPDTVTRTESREPPAPQHQNRASLFFFDPNTTSSENWKALGVNTRSILTIKHYLEKGGHFKTPEDLQKIYGLREEDIVRLKPFVRIHNTEPEIRFSTDSKRAPWKDSFHISHPQKKTLFTVDINNADSVILEKLPGIGSRLAGRIIHFRDKLGGFYSIDQVGETYGLPDSTFSLIKSFLALGTKPVATININQADVARLRQHPYINWATANGIVRYREQHGAYQSLEDLSNISIISGDQLRRLIPYLSIY